MKYKSIKAVPIALVMGLMLSSCAVGMAASGGKSYNFNVLVPGADRSVVVAEFGTPALTDTDEAGRKYDVFSVREGSSGAARFFRAFFYAITDIATLGLTEILWTPLEGGLGRGSDVQYKVIYNKRNKVSEYFSLKDDRIIK